MKRRTPPLDFDAAEGIGLRALGFLAGDPARLGRFLALTGIGPDDLRAEAGSPPMLAAVLAHLLDDESLLLAFTSMNGLEPERIAPAHDLLLHPTGGRSGR